MTGARQPGKSHRWPASALRLLLIVALAVFSTQSPAAEPAVTVDPNSGLAISGVDPVAYFTDGKPVFGLPQLELSLLGAVWRFRNAGNRTAFMENPDIYSPQFNGYDPVANLTWANGYAVGRYGSWAQAHAFWTSNHWW